jgi:hypothetical protein
MPTEILEMIFAWLPAHEPRHLHSTRVVCRTWHAVTSDANQPFWRGLFQSHHHQLLLLLLPSGGLPLRLKRHFEKEARRKRAEALLRLAAREEDGEADHEEEEEAGCWKRRYYQELHGIDMSEWEECQVKGPTHFLNGPRPGKQRPNYRCSASNGETSSMTAKQRRREGERQKRRNRRERYRTAGSPW